MVNKKSLFDPDTRYFLRPTPILFQVISETFQPEAFGELIVGTVMLIICGAKCNI